MNTNTTDSKRTVTITVTNSRLLALESNGHVLYWTPGAHAPYWAHSKHFTHDVCVATPKDFIIEAGYDTFDGMDDDAIAEDTLSLDIQYPFMEED